MRVTNSILDEGSSLGTTDDSEIIVPRPGDDSLNEADWGVVSLDGSEHPELILEETPKELVDSKIPGEEGSQLSVADSVPTVVGSIDGLHTEEKDKKLEPSSEVKTADLKDGSSIAEAGVQTSPIEQPTAPKNSRLVFLLVPALLLVPAIASSICLYNERNSLQMSVMELEDVISSLHLEAEQRKLEEELLWEDKEILQLSSQELQDKVFSLKREAESKKKRGDFQLDTLKKERGTLKLYILHLQDVVASLKKKAAKEKREGDILFQDKTFLEWSASSLQQKLKNLKMDAEKKKHEEEVHLQSLKKEKSLLQGLVAQSQSEITRVKEEADQKMREEELRWNSLFQEKNSLRVSTARLEHQVSRLKKKAKKAKQGRKQEEFRREFLEKERDTLLSTVIKLEDKVSALKKQAGKRKQAVDLLNLNSCEAEAGETTLVDNCWLNARANIQLGDCANDAKDVVKGALHNFSESLSHWMDSYTAAAEAYFVQEISSKNDTAGSVRKMVRKRDHVVKKVSNADATKGAAWNTTSSKKQGSTSDVGKSVARMMRTVDSFGRALWNATAFRMHRSGNAAPPSQGRSFFSRMDLNGKLWFESFFTPSSKRKARRADNRPSNLDKIFHKVSEIILAAGNPDQLSEEASAMCLATSKNSSMGGASEVFMTSTLESLCGAMAFNRTSKKYLMKVAKNAFEEVSLSHSVTM